MASGGPRCLSAVILIVGSGGDGRWASDPADAGSVTGATTDPTTLAGAHVRAAQPTRPGEPVGLRSALSLGDQALGPLHPADRLDRADGPDPLGLRRPGAGQGGDGVPGGERLLEDGEGREDDHARALCAEDRGQFRGRGAAPVTVMRGRHTLGAPPVEPAEPVWICCTPEDPCIEHRPAAEDLPERALTMPDHEVSYLEHGRGHARAEWRLNRHGEWVARCEASYVLGELAAGRRELQVVTKRGRVETITVERTGRPFVTTRVGHRLIYVWPVLDGRTRRKRRPERVPSGRVNPAPKPAPAPVPLPGSMPCAVCGAMRRALFDAVDADGVPGQVCVRCDAEDRAGRVVFADRAAALEPEPIRERVVWIPDPLDVGLPSAA